MLAIFSLFPGGGMHYFPLILFSLLLMANCGNQQQKRKPNIKIKKGSVIYGENDIKEYYQIDSLKLRSYAQSIAVQVPKTLLQLEDSHYLINHEKMGSLNLCEDQDDFHRRLSSQPPIGICTAFLVSEKTLLTAGHCLDEIDYCQNSFWVFDFKIQEEHDNNISFPEENIYSCHKVLAHNKILDYALIELDRKTQKRTPLKLRQRKRLLSNAPLVVVGFPEGWPLKYSLNSKIRENDGENFFVINSDTFEGNSGSPVINTKNGLVEGILISGEKDFNGNQSSPAPCQTLKRCPEDQCIGENILRITSLTENFLNGY